MGYIVIFMFCVTLLFALFEEQTKRYRLPVYLVIGALLVLVAGLREVGIDPDSLNYEGTFLNNTSANAEKSVEYSFLLISQILHSFSNDVHSLFLLYALLGVALKMYAFRKLSSLWLLPLAMYICNYFIVHECMQIRTGVLSGMLLLAIYYIGEEQKKKALLCLMIGTFFHYSGLIMLPIFLLSNKEITKRQKIIWALVIPISYGFVFYGFNALLTTNVDIPFIGDKFAIYQNDANTKGTSGWVNIYSPFRMLTIFLFYYTLFFHDTIIRFNKYLPLQIKMFALGNFFYIAFSFFPVFASRVCMLYEIVTIPIFASIFYTIRPKWASYGLMFLFGLLLLNYSLGNIGFVLFWKV